MTRMEFMLDVSLSAPLPMPSALEWTGRTVPPEIATCPKSELNAPSRTPAPMA